MGLKQNIYDTILWSQCDSTLLLRGQFNILLEASKAEFDVNFSHFLISLILLIIFWQSITNLDYEYEILEVSEGSTTKSFTIQDAEISSNTNGPGAPVQSAWIRLIINIQVFT